MSSNKPKAMDVRSISKQYPLRNSSQLAGRGRSSSVFQALDGVSFQVAPGEVVGVVGLILLGHGPFPEISVALADVELAGIPVAMARDGLRAPV